MYNAVRALLSLLFLSLLPLASYAQSNIPRYGEFEASWTLPHQTGNPFDPAQNDIEVVFHAPDRKSYQVPAFWDGSGWQVRYAPEQVGNYTLTVLRSGRPADPIGLTENKFHCIPSDSPGFIRTDPKDIQHFLFQNGQSYYPFGMDQAWGEPGIPGYPETFQLMHRNDLNWARVWMTFWDGKALEWTANKADNPPIGWFSMAAAQTWDTIFQAADKYDVNIQMVLQHHGQYTSFVDPNWPENPYNVANGGFLKQPQDFFTNPEAIRLTEAKYRYIVARWGYSTHLMAFELFNEVQNIKEAQPDFGAVVAWHKTMAAYLRSIDVDHHLITTSISAPPSPLASIGLSYDQIHTYVPDIISYFSSLEIGNIGVPIFLGEWGSSSATQTQSFLHDGLWSGIMVPTAAAPEYWYWDTVYRNHWYPTFRAASLYVSASRMADQTGFQKLSPQVLSANKKSALSFAPPLGWANTTSSDVHINPDGSIFGIAGVSSYIQGNNHRNMLPQPIVFHLRCAQPCQFQLQIGTVAQAGAEPQLSLDGQVAAARTYAPASANKTVNDTLTVSVPVGIHTVSLANPGTDWFTVNQITLTDYAPALAVVAKGNDHSVYFWAYSRDRTGTQPVSGTVSLAGLYPGRYLVHLWNTQAGEPLQAPFPVHVGAGPLVLKLPLIREDIAGWVVK